MNSRRSRGTLIALVVAAALVRIPFAWQYPNPDISLFSVVGHRLLQGDALYTDIFDIKPPLTFLLYAMGEALVGQGAPQIILLGAAASVLALAGCHALAREIEPRAGLVAAVLWLLFSVDVTLEAQHPNGELLANAALVWAVVFVARSRAAPAGLLFAAATLIKQNTIVVPFVLALLLVGRREWRAPAAWLAIGAAIWGAILGWYAAVGRLGDALYALFEWPAFYVGDPLANWLAGFFPQLLFGRAGITLLFAVVALGIVRWSRAFPEPADSEGRARARAAWIAFAYLVGTHAAWALPGEFFAHYAQLFVPPVVVLSAAFALRVGPQRWGRAPAWGLVVAVAASIGWESTRSNAEDRTWPAADAGLAGSDRRAAVARLRPADDVAVIGNLPAAYVVTGSRPPGGFLHFRHYATGPRAQEATARVVSDLSRWMPRTVLVDEVSVDRFAPDNAAAAWVRENYVDETDDASSVRIYRRSQGREPIEAGPVD